MSPWWWMMAVACASDATVVVGGQTLSGEAVQVRLAEGRVVAVGPTVDRDGAEVIDVQGRVVLPGLVDSHVHLAYLPEADALADGGIAGAVDLAAPAGFVGRDGPLEVLWSGPMVTAVGGYPTRSWGAGGYGRECAGAEACAAVVDELLALGASVIKVPLTAPPSLSDEELQAVVDRAHARGVKVVVHALDDAGAARAAAAGCDALAHLPTEPLSDATVAAWSGRHVISTGGAFGGDAAANAARLHSAGATLLYGTDFGNTRVRGIDADELKRLVDAGLSPVQAIEAATEVPARWWGTKAGRLVEGAPGVLVVVEAEVREDVTELGRPWRVVRSR
jgi:imidazolonepropionase-like amidohydrolase